MERCAEECERYHLEETTGLSLCASALKSDLRDTLYAILDVRPPSIVTVSPVM